MILVLTLSIASLGLFWLYVSKKHDYFKDHGIPYAPGYFPLGSSLIWNCFKGQEALLKVPDKYYDQFHDTKIFGYYKPFGTPVLVIKDLELAKKIMIKDFDHFIDRKFITPNPKANKLASKMLLCLQGDAWKTSRNLLSPMFTASKLRSIMPLIHQCGEDLTKYLARFFNDHIDCKDVFQRFTIEILGSLGCGITPHVLKSGKNVFYEQAMFLSGATMPKLKAALNMVTHVFLPDLAHFLNLKVMDEDNLNFFTKVIKTSLEARRTAQTKRNDFIDLLKDSIEELEPEKRAQYSDQDVEDFVIANAVMLFFVGNDTSSGALALSLHNLAKYPEIQAKLKEEIQEAVERNNGNILLDYEALNDLPFMGKFIKETIRHWGSNFFDRACTKDYFIPEMNYTIPKGMHVTLAGGKMMTDGDNFPNPLEFDPETNFDSNLLNPPNFLGFGQGPRNCIGMRLAYTIIRIGLLHVLTNFEVVKGPKSKDHWTLNPVVPGGVGHEDIFVILKPMK